jgi:hypothetical protein
MGKRSSAFPLLGNNLPAFCEKLANLPTAEFWVHEKKLVEYLNLPCGPQHGPTEVFTALVRALKVGYGGDRRKGTQVMTGRPPIDLYDANNQLGVHCQMYGSPEAFDGGHLSEERITRRPRWFKIGDKCAIEVGEQVAIANELVGDVAADRETSDRAAVLPKHVIRQRKTAFATFYRGESGCQTYRAWDVPHIASRYLDMWGFDLTEHRGVGGRVVRRSFRPADLDAIENDFRTILAFSNVIGRIGTSSDGNMIATRSTAPYRAPRAINAAPSQANVQSSTIPSTPSSQPRPQLATPSPTSRSEQPSTSPSPSLYDRNLTGDTFPQTLRLKSLRCTCKGTIMWGMVKELVSLKFMVELAFVRDTTWDNLELDMLENDVRLPDTLSVEDVRVMSKRDLANAAKNIKDARDDLLEHMGEYFQPMEDDFLHTWLRWGLAISAGRRPQASVWELNDSNRQECLSLRSAWILRHIMFSFNLPINTVVCLWVCFYALIMGKPISEKEFAVGSTIWNNVERVRHIDNATLSERFGKAITQLSKYGFRRYFHISSDDSKHFKRNRHVLIMTTFEGCDTEDWTTANFVYPTCRLVTCRVNMVKSSNADMNADALVKLVGLRSAAYLGGGTADNAADAQKEQCETFAKVMTEVGRSSDESIRELRCINGVERRAINFGDPYHWANLAVTHASKAFAGDTENGAHEKIHHRQCLMSMHSLHSDDPGYSRTVMDRVMNGTNDSVQVQTWRERQQRWLVNQRYAKRVLAMLFFSTALGVPCLVAWALYFHNFNRSQWKSRVGREVATWLSMPSIILGFHFESELGEPCTETILN